MKRIAIIEQISNTLDLGYFREVFFRALKKEMEMGPKEFISRLFRARGFSLLTPPQYEALVRESSDLLTVDLREERQFDAGHIPGAVSHPFDDFLGAVLMEGDYRNNLSSPVVLVCDTGHMSRVAASMLWETGFKEVYSISRGMRRMNRWERIKQVRLRGEGGWCRICTAMFASIKS
jgi:rhodanese-related sulfurtransferase